MNKVMVYEALAFLVQHEFTLIDNCQLRTGNVDD